jgi:hypothetical protein
MANSVIVLVSDLDNAVRGEINVLASADEAARLVESLISSGFESERIRVFQGDEMQMEVHHRPVVSLSNDSDERATKEVASAPASEPAPVSNGKIESVTVEAAKVTLAGVASEPFTRDGVRFSKMFSPDVFSPA